jgi:hypothetical protein
MPALRKLNLRRYEAQVVLLPGTQRPEETRRCIRITVFGDVFPIRAVEPEILVGGRSAEGVEVSQDQRSIRGYLPDQPRRGAVIRVRYGDSQEGRLVTRFEPGRVKALPKECS